MSVLKKNLLLAAISVLALVLISLVLFRLDILHKPKLINNWYESEADWFLTFASVVAIVGAFWAVLARIDAEKAFRAAEEAREQSKKTYDALANSFHWLKIYDNKKNGEEYEDKYLPYIYDSIGQEDITITLLLNFPVVGLFENSDLKFVEKARETFSSILKPKLENLFNNFPRNSQINIACYSETFAMTFLNDSSYSEDKRRIEEFYTILKRLKIKYPTDDRFNCFYFNQDIGLRLGLVKHNTERERGQALVWTVSDFHPSSSSNFEATAFKTMDRNFIDTLNKMFINFKTKADNGVKIAFQNEIGLPESAPISDKSQLSDTNNLQIKTSN